MISDHLLNCFQLPVPEPDVYRIGQYTPVSVRDQIVRACYLVQRLWATGRLAPNKKLLVVGAGAGGLAVAVKAIHFGMKQVLVADLADRAMSLQAYCNTRWVDPVQYDWPAYHWDQQQWPISGTASLITSPFLLKADNADGWAADMDLILQNYEQKGNIKFHPNRKVVGWHFENRKNRYEVTLHNTQTLQTEKPLEADVIVFAGGFGRESTSVRNNQNNGSGVFESIPFWASDKFQHKDFGLPSVKHGVLVSGGGDGGLQDFIRLVTGQRSARDIWLWLQIQSAIDSVTLRQLESLWHWEENAHRCKSFAPAFRSQCQLLSELHSKYTGIISTLRQGPGWGRVASVLDGLVGSRPTEFIILATRCSHFDVCYPLNRLVALLLAEYLENHRHPGRQAIRYSTSTEAVSAGPATSSWGMPVTAILVPGTNCSMTVNDIAAFKGQRKSVQLDGLVIRHGIDTSTLSLKSSKLSLQPVPAHLP